MELLKLYWKKIDQEWVNTTNDYIKNDNYDFNGDEFVIDIKNKKILSIEEDITNDFIVTEDLYFIGLEPVSSELKLQVECCGIESLMENDMIEYVSNYIDFLTDGKNYSLSELIKRSDITWTEGEFFLQYTIDIHQCNHPEDPTEYDCTITCEGVLGHDIKLIKDGK